MDGASPYTVGSQAREGHKGVKVVKDINNN